MVPVSSKSILIAFLAAPRAIELTVTDNELCSPYFSLVYTWFNVQCSMFMPPCHDGDNYSILGTSVNLQFAKLEQRTYGPWPRHENAQ